ncbi:helix-turn-helix domain-containing protein [Cohnella abietis]|uniref:HTH cro/C1-type domain-containing protein n=1 Tax=Cohnella abietis TaxID=2507935 RepID=A0A3T1D1S6_9BACL|nr:helix-turn-helix transcriptional regulator [Cohnella abietis]BBI32008.1 hypothetical protein KCTCHS21_14070 [Cohnella abietis]
MLGERIKQLRKEKKKTHQDMADFLGITRQAYGYYESGKRDVDTETLTKLADFFDVSLDYMVGRTEENHQALSKSSGRAYYGGGADWTDDERKLADAAVEDWRRRKKEMEANMNTRNKQ